MATIDWALVCSAAFFDQQQRLCMIGIAREFPVPQLPIVVRQVMLVARLRDLSLVDEIVVTVAVVTPSGLVNAPVAQNSMVVERAGEFVLVTMRDVPLAEEGAYSFQVALRGQPAVTVDIPVLTTSNTALADVH
ncbi:MAG TPA: hypothetical protein VKB50_30635 [Vicinamibacterales bacterium]|nr:hypothetical protein [Vicinamibacterales bacterium]